MKFTIDIDLSNTKAVALLNYIKTLDFIRINEHDSDEQIPIWQINEATKRLDALEKNPENAIDFDETINKIEAKYGL